jgi:hypothetical protein
VVDKADCIDTSFTQMDFHAYWKKAKEHTSLSLSSLHFGHYYKAVMDNDKLSKMHSIFIDIAVNLVVHLMAKRAHSHAQEETGSHPG